MQAGNGTAKTHRTVRWAESLTERGARPLRSLQHLHCFLPPFVCVRKHGKAQLLFRMCARKHSKAQLLNALLFAGTSYSGAQGATGSISGELVTLQQPAQRRRPLAMLLILSSFFTELSAESWDTPQRSRLQCPIDGQCSYGHRRACSAFRVRDFHMTSGPHDRLCSHT